MPALFDTHTNVPPLLYMMSTAEDEHDFEIAVAVSKRELVEEEDCVDVLVKEFNKAGLIAETISGVSDDFIKLAAPLDTLGRVAGELKVKKLTHIGIDLLFKLEEKDAFVRQPDGSLFSWSERFRFYQHLIYGIINKSESDIPLRHDGRIINWEAGESLLRKIESECIVKDVFPLHVESKRKRLLKMWAFNWRDLTTQPVDKIYCYFGTKMALYFAFLGMYTRWTLFPAVLGLIVHLVDLGRFQFLVLPVFFVCVVLWSMMFSQFWKRKNAALLARWRINNSNVGANASAYDLGHGEESSSLHPSVELISKLRNDRRKYKQVYQRKEWFGTLMRFRNDAFVILSIVCLQLPFELAYAHLYDVVSSDITKFFLTAIYLFHIQYFTRMCGRISVRLINYENNANREYRADSLIYKVFGLYFMQSYIGLFYHALIHGNFSTLRKVLIQRLVVSEILGNFRENMIPYMRYKYGKYKVRSKTKHEKGTSTSQIHFKTRVEKEYLKPAYSASIGDEFEDGLFDDLLELSLQFGTMMMLACAYPPAFVFSALNNVMEIRTDALKLLVTMKRPVPRAAASIGAWLNIFQFLSVMSICTNSVLLVWLYDREGKWKIEPGLAAILIMEHVLLLIKIGVSQFVSEEPAWVRASRIESAAQVQELYSKELLTSVSASDKERRRAETGINE